MTEYQFYTKGCSGCASIPKDDNEVALSYLIDLAERGGELVRRGFYDRDKKVSAKFSASDLVTEIDTAVEQLLTNQIRKDFPAHRFLCEESAEHGAVLGTDPTWMIDPVDGTFNYVHCFPMSSISIGFARNRRVILAALYNPVTETFFFAQKGRGAFLNNIANPIKLPLPMRDLKESLVSLSSGAGRIKKLRSAKAGDPARKELEEFASCVIKILDVMREESADVRMLGSTALELGLIANGQIDACVHLGPKEWDLAAGSLVLMEAGGVIGDGSPEGINENFNLGRRRVVAATSTQLYTQIIKSITLPKLDVHKLE